MTPLTPDREMLSRFADLMFRHANRDGVVSLRAFPDKKSEKGKEKAIFTDGIRINDPAFLDVVTERAHQAATWDEPAVFAPPVATFRNNQSAKTENLNQGVCLSVECDQNPQAARSTLEATLGTATTVVASGGEWTNPKTGEIEAKLHLHWRLREPTSTSTQHECLREARELATRLVGGDATSISIVHPLRWPGSWHRKGQPRLVEIVASSDNEIDLGEALDILRDAVGVTECESTGVRTTGRLEASNHAAVGGALAMIPNGTDPKAHDWDYWNGIGLKTWAATAGSEIGRKVFHKWSARSPKYDKKETDVRWDHYRTSPPTKAGFGSLIYLARQHSPGWTYGNVAAANRLGESSSSDESDVDLLNRKHAVLPIGGKTRVVTFGELPEFPGRETIVMTQTIDDFTALKNKYRHVYRDNKGNQQSQPMGSHWIGSPKRRQYDGGMAFLPWHEGDAGDKLNLWRGFGVKPIKPDGKSGAEGCPRFLDFMRDIICSGNEEHFDYLRKREAFIVQERTRSEVALALQTKQEGCGKGFYERVMAQLLGNHAMQIGNADHLTGKFNPHLESLLRVTADEALFVGDPKHRNALFGLVTEPTMTIEPKNCGVYTANSYLNVSITSNAGHFIPVSDTARRFFVPTVSAARMQDYNYFASLQAELDNGGYEALLHHLLHEVDLTGFNVRKVPQTEALRKQRDQSLPPLEAWWCELLESGTLKGSDPMHPNRAVSNSYTRIAEVETFSYGTTQSKQPRTFTQPGLFDQARQIEPRLRNYTNDHMLGRFLSEMGCDNTKKVLRRQGWTFRPLSECRAAWEKNYPEWRWRNPELKDWQPEGDDFEDFADLKCLDAADVIELLDKKRAREQT